MDQVAAAPSALRRLISFNRIVTTAHLWRTAAGDDAGSLRKMILANRPDIVVTGETLPTGVLESVLLAPDRPPVIMYNRRYNQPAQRVAVAHGVAHVLFDVERAVTYACGRAYEDERVDIIERRADLFAGELLCPLEDLDEAFAGADLFPRSPGPRRKFDDYCDHVASQKRVPVGFLRWRLYDLAKLRGSHLAG
jgi:Zn-dependent peptidase ImmA (M78 family)